MAQLVAHAKTMVLARREYKIQKKKDAWIHCEWLKTSAKYVSRMRTIQNTTENAFNRHLKEMNVAAFIY